MNIGLEAVTKNDKKAFYLSGEIDMHSSPVLRKELMKLVDRKITPLIVDFGGVSYIDSSGIATFVEVLKSMMEYGGALRLTGIPDSVMEIFRFARLDSVFDIYESVDNAVAC